MYKVKKELPGMSIIINLSQRKGNMEKRTKWVKKIQTKISDYVFIN
jgi:hypothetical protein